MAARLNPRHTEEVRTKIQASVLINRVNKHAMGELEMTSSQLKAAEILLDRSVPKLQAIQIDGELNHKVNVILAPIDESI